MSRVRIPFNPRVSGWLVVAATTALAITGLTQCQMMPSTVTGVEVTPSGFGARSDCMHRCNEGFKDAREDERDRHHQALEACGRDQACKRAERERHEDNLVTLVKNLRACKKGCYNEGGGDGGNGDR